MATATKLAALAYRIGCAIGALGMVAFLQDALPSWIGAVFAVGAFIVGGVSLLIQVRDRRVRLDIIQEKFWGADNQDGGLPRFVVYNAGAKPINIANVMVDTLPNVTDRDRREGTVAVSMEVVEGNVPGWLRPGHHVRLHAHDPATTLKKHGFSGETDTELIVVDALDKERRYPITLKVEGSDNVGEFDLETHW